jgi:hypothetical protein
MVASRIVPVSLDFGLQSVQGAAAKPTKTIAFNAVGIGVLSWRSDANYYIVQVNGLGQALLNVVGATYATLTTAGTHIDWICIGATSTSQASTVALRAPILLGQLLYCSCGSGNSFIQVILESF